MPNYLLVAVAVLLEVTKELAPVLVTAACLKYLFARKKENHGNSNLYLYSLKRRG